MCTDQQHVDTASNEEDKWHNGLYYKRVGILKSRNVVAIVQGENAHERLYAVLDALLKDKIYSLWRHFRKDPVG